MNRYFKDQRFWICRLKSEELETWAKGTLDKHARFLGIKGWIVPLEINKDGTINKSFWNNLSDDILAAPWIHLAHPMSPAKKLCLHLNYKNGGEARRH